jgi:hypothetical protein
VSLFLIMFGCNSKVGRYPPTVEAEPMALNDMLSLLQAMVIERPTTTDSAGLLLVVDLVPIVDGSRDNGKWLKGDGALFSDVLVQVDNRGVLRSIRATVKGDCVSLSSMRDTFGWAFGVPVHPGASRDGDVFYHDLSPGRLYGTYLDNCLSSFVYEL